MKSFNEIKENLEGCEARLQESYDEMANNAATLTSEQVVNYRKTQAYLRGWIAAIRGDSDFESYTMGYKQALTWLDS